MLKSLLLEHWVAKIVSLVLAVTLWAVIKKNLETIGSPFSYELRGDDRFQLRSHSFTGPAEKKEPPKDHK